MFMTSKRRNVETSKRRNVSALHTLCGLTLLGTLLGALGVLFGAGAGCGQPASLAVDAGTTQDAAIAELEAAMKKDQPDPEACYSLAKLYLQRGEVGRSLDLIVETIRAQPATYGQAEAALAEAASEGRQAKRSTSQESETSRRRNVVTSRREDAEGGVGGRCDELAEHGRRLVERCADDAVARYIYGQSLLLARHRDEAMEAFRAAARLDERFAPTFVAIARLSVEDKRWPDVLAATTAAIETGIDGAEAHLLKGLAHEALDEHAAAEAALMEAFRRDRASPEALYILAESAERRGLRGRCEELYRRIIDEVDPLFVPAREQLVRLYLNSNDVGAAIEYFAGFARQEQTGPAFARCRAYLNFKTKRGDDRLEKYKAELRQAIADYPQDVRTYADLAMTHFASGDYEDALVQIDKAMAVDADDLRVRELKALTEAKMLRFGVVAEVLKGLLRDRPRSLSYQAQLLESDLDRADFEAAEASLRKLLEREDLGERRTVFMGKLVEVLQMAQRSDEAADLAKEWLDESPDDAMRRVIYLSSLNKAGRHDEAIDSAAYFLAEDPAGTEARLQLTTQLVNAGRYVEAQQRILSWLADDPDEINLNEELIRVCLLAKQWDSAIALAHVGTEQIEHQGRYERWLCRGYLMAERFDDAVAFYQDRLNFFESAGRRAGRAGDGAREELYYEATRNGYGDLISALTAAKRFAEAEQVVNRLLLPQTERRDEGEEYDGAWVITLRRYLARIYQLTDREAQATQQLEEIHALLPRDAGINNDLGYTWADAGIKLEQAERMIRLAAGEDPRNYAYMDSLGWVLYKRGRMDEAIYYLRLAIRQGAGVDGEDAVIHDHLGDALYRVGRADEAGIHWRKALELTRPADDSPPDEADQRLPRSVQTKLRQLAEGQAVAAAPLAGPPAAAQAGETTVPAATTRPAATTGPGGQDGRTDEAEPPAAVRPARGGIPPVVFSCDVRYEPQLSW
ncbi:MAG: tetratricopeptide repeat protein [Phycisphaerae bacterium]|nr:tetratricopeptide repeat protein [Phycisphaerae bacterium]